MLQRVFVFLLICISCNASAQTWQIHAEGGLLWNSNTGNLTPDHRYGYAKSGMAGAGLSYRRNRIEVGLTLGYRRHAFRIEGDEYGFDPLTGYAASTSRHYRFIEKLPAVFAAPFINYHFKVKKLDWHAGIAPVYLRFFGYSQENPKLNLKDGGNGYGLDLRGGCEYPLIKRVSLFSELSFGAVYLPVYYWGDAHMYTGSLSIGAKLKL